MTLRKSDACSAGQGAALSLVPAFPRFPGFHAVCLPSSETSAVPALLSSSPEKASATLHPQGQGFRTAFPMSTEPPDEGCCLG